MEEQKLPLTPCMRCGHTRTSPCSTLCHLNTDTHRALMQRRARAERIAAEELFWEERA